MRESLVHRYICIVKTPLSALDRADGSTHRVGLESRKEFDMKYVAGYHKDNQLLNSLFLLIKVGSRNHIFHPRIF